MIYLNTLLAEAKLKLNIPSDIKKIKRDLKPFVKGKIYQGFVDGVKKFIKQRGGKV